MVCVPATAELGTRWRPRSLVHTRHRTGKEVLALGELALQSAVEWGSAYGASVVDEDFGPLDRRLVR